MLGVISTRNHDTPYLAPWLNLSNSLGHDSDTPAYAEFNHRWTFQCSSIGLPNDHFPLGIGAKAMAAASSEYAHQTKGPRILAVFWTMTSLAIVLVVARLFIRIKVLHSPGADDWLIVASMVSRHGSSGFSV